MNSLRTSRPGGLAALVAAMVIVMATINIRVPYYALTPGPTQDVSKLISIEAETTSVNGQLLLTTVSLHPISVWEAVRGWVDPSITILSRSVIIPAGSSEREVEQRTTAQMQESHVVAAAAALELLGYEVEVEPSGVRIRAVAEDVPAAKTLRRGDVVVGADGAPVLRAEDLQEVVRRHKVGDVIGLRIVRGSSTVDVTAETVGRPDNPSDPVIGIHLETVPRVNLPVAVRINSLGIGGPSAGLMFAVGIYDLIDEGDLSRGRIIAGTGEISIEGEVRPVGGIRQKVESARRVGAQLFLVPLAELGQACAVAHEMAVVGVEDLREAVEVLRGTGTTAVRTCD